MSAKSDKVESPGAKVLQKARSFKHDLKSRIKRTPSASRSEKEPSPSRKQRAQSNRKKVGRTISFNEGCKNEGDAKHISDAEKLDQDGSKVFNAIKYLRDVVTKGVLEQLSGATNIVLESVAEILQSVSKYFISQESTLLASISSQVYQSLANLIQWSDHRMLDRAPLDKKYVQEYIDPLEQGIKELLRLSKEKLQLREIGGGSKTIPRIPGHRKASSSDGRCPSIQDSVPLTPEEIQILNHGKVLKSASQSNGNDDLDLAPPKPPLPHSFSLKGTNGSHGDDEDDVFSATGDASPDDVPPPLPVKLKSRAHSSYDNADEPDTMVTNTPQPVVPQNPAGLPIPDIQVRSGSCSPASSVTSHNAVDSAVAMVTTPRSQSPASSISSVKSGASMDFLFERSGLSTPRTEVGIPEQRLSHYDNHQAQWVAGNESSSCDKKSAESSLSSQIVMHHSSTQHSSRVLQQTKQQVSVHSSTFDSGIYDNKNCSGQFDHRANMALASGERGDSLPPPLPDKKNKRPSVDSSASTAASTMASLSPMLARPRVPSMYDNITEESSRSQTVSMATKSSSSSIKTQTISGTDASGLVQRQFIQNVSNTQTAAAMRAKRTMNVVAGGRQFITSSATVSQSMQMKYVKETFCADDDGMSDEQTSLDGDPPPLPPKKRPVHTYMQIFGQSSALSPQEITRKSIKSQHFYHEQWQQHQMEVHLPNYRRSNTFSVETTRDKSCHPDLYSMISGSSLDTSRSSDVLSVVSGSSSEDGGSVRGSVLPTPLPDTDVLPAMPQAPMIPELPDKLRISNASSSSGVSSRQSDPNMTSSTQSEATEEEEPPIMKDLPPKKSTTSEKRSSAPVCSPTTPPDGSTVMDEDGGDRDSAYSEIVEKSILDEVDVSKHLVRKKPNDDGHDLRGGCLDALIVHATTTGKHDFMYQEAFLTTYRTIITSHELVEKLIYRYNRFSRMNDVKLKKLSRNAFSLLTRVVNELCTEVDEHLIEMLMTLVFQMLCDGDLTLARLLRSKVLEKCIYLQKLRQSHEEAALWPQHKLSTKQFNVFNFKSQDIAEQMTLLDAELFQKIEIPEVLLYAREQVEEQSPNLTQFTEHFNKMSYWCRTRIMEQEDPKDREHCFVKFIKIMRYLEKFNNFNSYLAILSALSSSPLSRLDWQKQNAETLAQYFLLIDNSHGFRTYRQRLSETEPPCIPYIGLILQDLTFVHVGNKDWLSENVINFVKRWQQFGILDNMRRFKTCNYEFTKKEKILQFFNHFDNYLPEETLWQISEAIKPPKRTIYKSNDK